MPRRVIKLGGSLLDFAALAPRLRDWLAAQPSMSNVMVVGGGRLADAIRDAYATHSLGEEAAHWLCIRLLGVTAELVASLLPEAVLLKRYEELTQGDCDGRLVVFDPEQFLREEASIVTRSCRKGIVLLPHTWDATSDSIAARLAVVLDAEELVLLKSSLPSGVPTLQHAADAGYVDRHFPIAAADLPHVRCVNFRSNDFADISLL